MLDAKIKFFDIQQCGFYKHGEVYPSFGNVVDMLRKLHQWGSDGRDFVNTKTYAEDRDNDIYRTFFCGWHENEINGDSLLVLWNEVDNDNGVIYGMNPQKKPGSMGMIRTGFTDSEAIPGFPSYFWFIPEINVFATIKFNHSKQGKSNLDRYIKGFLCNKSPYRVYDSDDKVIGFSRNGEIDKDSTSIRPRFRAISKKNDELVDELIRNVKNIRKFIKREYIDYETQDERSFIERVFSGLLDNVPCHGAKRLITHELNFIPDERQLRQIINNYEQLPYDTDIKNVGFGYANGKRVMLNGANMVFKNELQVSREDDQIIYPQELLNALTLMRENMIRSLNGSGAFLEEAGAG